jgi:DNA-binding CsgD family transcriptional regulator
MTETAKLRPIERRVIAMKRAGFTEAEIARRFRRSPGFIRQVDRLANLEERHPDLRRRQGGPLRPVERRILRWRERGVALEDLAERFRRSPEFVARVEHLARYKLRRAGD